MKVAGKIFLEKLREAAFSILPIFVIVLILGTTVVPLSFHNILTFVLSSFLLVFGLLLFTNGAESSMLLMGTGIGSSLSKARRMFVFIVSSFILGMIITIAEPDLMVFASQIASVNNWVFIFAVGMGVGFMVTIAVLRIIFQVKMKYILLGSYALVLILMFFAPQNFIAVAFDASGVTTGPISSPFILSFGLGVSAVRASKKAQEDSFGLIGLASVGPILFVLILSLFLRDTTLIPTTVETAGGSGGTLLSIFGLFGENVLLYMREIGIVILAILLAFFVFNFTLLKLPKTKIKKILVGLAVTYVGIVIYLTGVSVGYFPISSIIGYGLMNFGGLPFVIALMLVIGFGIVVAEPAVHVLSQKVYEITGGSISKKIMFISISISMSVAMILSIVKVIYNIPFIYFIVPLYVAILILMFFTPQIFTSIAFDSGGVASGPMATSFLLPLTTGIALSLGTGAMVDAFGTIAFVSSMPLLTLQILGVAFKIHQKKKLALAQGKQKLKNVKIEILEFSE